MKFIEKDWRRDNWRTIKNTPKNQIVPQRVDTRFLIFNHEDEEILIRRVIASLWFDDRSLGMALMGLNDEYQRCPLDLWNGIQKDFQFNFTEKIAGWKQDYHLVSVLVQTGAKFARIEEATRMSHFCGQAIKKSDPQIGRIPVTEITPIEAAANISRLMLEDALCTDFLPAWPRLAETLQRGTPDASTMALCQALAYPFAMPKDCYKRGGSKLPMVSLKTIPRAKL